MPRTLPSISKNSISIGPGPAPTGRIKLTEHGDVVFISVIVADTPSTRILVRSGFTISQPGFVNVTSALGRAH